ncbi:MAG TPA: hypothetical protein VMM60_16015 [Ilumatobacter sp.]|nr:hypothetical protein [Ilumatobacter sp.]
MTTSNRDGLTVDDAIRQFKDAESALRGVMAASDALVGAAKKVDEAKALLADTQRSTVARLDGAQAALDSSEKSLADASSSVYGLAAELKDIARNLKDTAVALRSLNPAQLLASLEDIRRQQRATLILVAIALIVTVAARLF